MKAEFKREMNRNYMILHPEKEMDGSYALRMLSDNRITGLLPFQEKRIDGEIFLYFNITSRQSLARMMEFRSFKAKEICQITGDLIATMGSLERFLMDGDELCLDPDMIYVDPDDLKASFCFLPGSAGRFEDSFRKLARYLLDHVDHTDGEAVVLAFALFKAGEKENLGIRDLEKCLQAGERGSTELKMEKYSRKGEWHEGERTETEEYGRKNGEWLQNPSERPDQGTGKLQPFRDEQSQNLSSCEEKSEKRKNLDRKKSAIPILAGILMVAIPAGIYLFGGLSMVLEWKWMLLAAEGVLLAGMVFFGSDKEDEEETEQEEEWEVTFREEEEAEYGEIPESRKEVFRGGYGPEDAAWNSDRSKETAGKRVGSGRKNADSGEWQDVENVWKERTEKTSEEEELQTVLLTGRQIYPVTRRLVPENGGEEILVRYFPFIIGKNREIADLCLNLPQISRIHAKIEETEDGYMVTDLNSMNGTSVNGHVLETNERYPLNPGEILSIADQNYRFL